MTKCLISANTAACPLDKYCIDCKENKCDPVGCVFTYLDAAGICQIPITTVSNCLNYSSAFTCSFCDFGYDLLGDTCVLVSLEDCLIAEVKTTKCLVCKYGYKVNASGFCDGVTKCTISNCNNCFTQVIADVTTEFCAFCDDDYVTSNNTESCVAVTTTTAHCVTLNE